MTQGQIEVVEDALQNAFTLTKATRMFVPRTKVFNDFLTQLFLTIYQP